MKLFRLDMVIANELQNYLELDMGVVQSEM